MIAFPALGFLIGLWIGSYLPFFPFSIFLLIGAAGIMFSWLEWSNRLSAKQGVLVFCSMICGMVYWTGATWMHNQADLERWIGPRPMNVTGSVIQPVRRTSDRVVMVADVSHVTHNHTPTSAAGNLLVTWRNPDRAVYQGDQIQFSARVRRPFGTINPGGFHYGAYLERKGIQAVATVSGSDQVKIMNPASSSVWMKFWNSIDQWRGQVQQAAVDTLDDPSLGLFLGMVLGEQGFISQEIREAFMDTGTVHIISISGSHLGLIAFLTFVLVKGLVLRLPGHWLAWLSIRITATRLAVLATLPLVSFYTLLAGAEIATVRSWIMILLFLLAVWLGREQNVLMFLLLAAVIVLVYHPQALYEISFQLSYISVLAIALVIKAFQQFSQENEDTNPVKNSISRTMGRWINNTWWVSLAVTLATVPIVAYHFNQIAWMGLLANFFVVPYVGFVVVPLGLVSAVIVLLTGADSLPLGVLNQTVLEGLTRIVQLFAKLPWTEWHVASPAIVTMLVFYGLLVTGLMNVNRLRLRWSCVMGVVMILILWFWSPRLEWDHDTVRVTFLDVGQGDATVIELPDGQVVLIDAGASYSKLDMGQAVVGPFLWDQGIRRIDHVIATHPQWDHMGGLSWVIKKFQVGRYWSNGVTRENVFFQRVQEAIQEVGLKEQVAWKGKEITRAGPCRLTVLNPPFAGNSNPGFRNSSQGGSDLNNQSVVTELDCGVHSFLFTADAEREALGRLNQLPHHRTAQVVKVPHRTAQVIKVPHHGAKSSLNREWINQLNAEAVVISAGRHNRYGHPIPAVLDAYREKGIPIYRTDQDGAVWVTASLHSPDLSIQTAQAQLLKPVTIDGLTIETELKNFKRILGDWI
ncbi:MAG: DNA internalization-related competence protein ComEC/Rec2 [Nitrospirota bacterium]|nr:MAG: DNA internalization-related competence protein ComEC/Rec2 [Nitrospirota bacterium]